MMFLIVLTAIAVSCIAASAFVQVKKPNLDVSPYAAGAGIAIVLLVVVYFTTNDPENPTTAPTQAENLGVAADPVKDELTSGGKDTLRLRD